MDPINLYQRMKRQFLKQYTIKLASKCEIHEIMNFIDNHWKTNHILAVSKDLMDWQHYDAESQTYSIILIINNETKEIQTLYSYIPTTQYDKNIRHPICWGALSVNRGNLPIDHSDKVVPGLGALINMYVLYELPYNTKAGLGISDMGFPLVKKLGYITGYCTQWYIIHPAKENFKLIGNYNKALRFNATAVSNDDIFINCNLEEYMAIDGDVLNTIPPYKSKTYYINRFFKHPIYTYHATKICNPKGIPKAVFFWRFCEHDGSKCIRVVDYFGSYDALIGQCMNFQKLLIDEDAEFIDFINVGIDKEYFEKAGFIDRSKTDIILANYFEPFLLENVDNSLRYQWYSKENLSPLLFKGDADQDRPSMIEVK